MQIGEKFGPHGDLKALYYTYLSLTLLSFFLWWMVPGLLLSISRGSVGGVYLLGIMFGVLVPCALFAIYWINRYFSSISFLLTEDGLVIEKGVWWKRKSYVCYNRVTNTDITQGPISRAFGLARVSVQTAGYSSYPGTSQSRPEAVIFGIKNFRQVNEMIQGFIRRMRPIAVEAGVETVSADTEILILEELKRIRESLEKRG